MGKVRGFFEYKIAPGYRENYLQWAEPFKRVMYDAGLVDMEVLESIQRPNQFIETFTVESMDTYEKIAKSLNGNPDYQQLARQLDKMLQGGREATKIWFFSEV